MITLKTFGGFEISGEISAANLPNRKSQALLSYLIYLENKPVHRTALVDMFWPELDEPAGLNNLSKTLGRIRKILADNLGDDSGLRVDRQIVQLFYDSGWQIDHVQFKENFEAFQRQTGSSMKVEVLENAAALYRGEYLAGLALENCPAYESWLLLQREYWVLEARNASQQLAAFYLAHGRFRKARDQARRQLELDNWHEEAHRQLMLAFLGLGQRSNALAQYEACRETLRKDLGSEPETVTQELFEKIKSGLDFSEITGSSKVRKDNATRLPKRLGALVGRDQDVEALLADLRDPTRRVVTLVGAGGVGKTSLALETAWKLRSEFRDGVYFVSLSSLQESVEDPRDQLITGIGNAIGLLFSGGSSLMAQLEARLWDKQTLFVLDNFERFMALADENTNASVTMFLVRLLESAPRVKALITSRQQIGIPEETVFSLQGLPFPDLDDKPDVESFSSMRLFLEQAQRIDRDFQITPENIADIAGICRLVDGLPLGIELAARWVNHLSPAEIAQSIQGDLNFLTAINPQVTRRHQSIRATLSYSWSMLTKDEQRTISQLSIFLGEFSREAVLQVTRCSLGVLVGLVVKSFLRQRSAGVYSLHNLLQQFAAEKLNGLERSEIQDLRRRFCNFYLNKLADLSRGFNKEWTGQALKEIGFHLENIRRAWRWALELGFFDLVETAAQPLFHYFRLRGLFFEAQQEFRFSLGFLRGIQRNDENREVLDRLTGRIMLRLGRVLWLMSSNIEAEQILAESYAILRQLGGRPDLARALVYLAEVSINLGRIAEAKNLLEEALLYHREAGSLNGLAAALQRKAFIAGSLQDYEEADVVFEESISVSRQAGNKRLEGRGMHDWGVILLRQGRYDEAAELFEKSLGFAEALGLQMPKGFNLSMLGRVYLAREQPQDALRMIDESLAILAGSGYAVYTIRALNALGEARAVLGQFEAARETLENARSNLLTIQPRDSDDFRYLVLDFLVAAAYLLAHTGQERRAARISSMVAGYDGLERDLGRRVHHLWAQMAANGYTAELAPWAQAGETGSLFEVLSGLALL